MGQGRTGYEIIRSWWNGHKTERPVEEQFLNPLRAKIGSPVRLTNVMATVRGEEVDLTNELFTVKSIRAIERSRDGHKLPALVDYNLVSGDKTVTLRLPEPDNERGGDLLLLTQHWPEQDGPYLWGEDSEPILAALTEGEFTRYAGTADEEVYFKDLSNVRGTASVISDLNGDGRVEIGEVRKEPLTLWTYRRDTDDAAGQRFTQHLQIELSGLFNEKTGNVSGGDKSIVMLRGEAIPTTSVVVY